MDEPISSDDAKALRLSALEHLESGRITVDDVALRLMLSRRQVIRLHNEFRKRGKAVLIHGNSGKRPANAIPADDARQIVHLVTTKYFDFPHAYVAWILRQEEGLDYSESTIRRVLAKADVRPPTSRAAPKHRRFRPRRRREGELLQMDASDHRWLGPHGPMFSLLGMIDDATNWPDADFREEEDMEGYFKLFRRIVETKGLPVALYADRDSVFRVNRANQAVDPFFDKPKSTQFGRLCADLGVRLIFANSSQAKGRVERLWRTGQGRLPGLARLYGADTMEQASKEALPVFLRHYRQQFVIPPQDLEPAWMPVPSEISLDDVFCLKFNRVLGRDYTVSLDGVLYQVPRLDDPAVRPNIRVTVHRHFNGTVKLFHAVRHLATFDPPEADRAIARPAPSHPWHGPPRRPHG